MLLINTEEVETEKARVRRLDVFLLKMHVSGGNGNDDLRQCDVLI